MLVELHQWHDLNSSNIYVQIFIVFTWHGHTPDGVIICYGSTLKGPAPKFCALTTGPFLALPPSTIVHCQLTTIDSLPSLDIHPPWAVLLSWTTCSQLDSSSSSHKSFINHPLPQIISVTCFVHSNTEAWSGQVLILGMLNYAGRKSTAADRAFLDPGAPFISTFREVPGPLSHPWLVHFLIPHIGTAFLQELVPPSPKPFHCRCPPCTALKVRSR